MDWIEGANSKPVPTHKRPRHHPNRRHERRRRDQGFHACADRLYGIARGLRAERRCRAAGRHIGAFLFVNS